MMPLLVIITGPPASGKTTLGRRLAQQLRLPYFYKDGFKELLFDHLGWKDREYSRQQGKASTAILFLVLRDLLSVGQSVAIESNFHAGYDYSALHEILAQHPSRVVQVVCTVSAAEFHKRWRQRAELGLRHPGHLDQQLGDEFAGQSPDPQGYILPVTGLQLVVDTTQLVESDIDRLVNQIEQEWHSDH